MDKFHHEITKNPAVFQENRLPAHSDHLCFRPDGKSDFRFSLNGTWKFSYAENYESAVTNFQDPDYDASGWDDIQVPSHIELSGYGKPQYVNTQYPWDGREEILPGQIPERYNPVGIYIRDFVLPDFMEGQTVGISFQGAESAIAVFLSGSYIGYSEDSFTPSEFDLTPFVRSGLNRIAVQIF